MGFPCTRRGGMYGRPHAVRKRRAGLPLRGGGARSATERCEEPAEQTKLVSRAGAATPLSHGAKRHASSPSQGSLFGRQIAAPTGGTSGLRVGAHCICARVGTCDIAEHGRIYNPPLQGAVRFVGVDALIDPTAKRPGGRRADVGIRPYGCGGTLQCLLRL